MNTDEKALVVRQSNELIEASYKIASIGEGRLIRMLIAQITPDDEDFKTYRIGITDFARFFGLSKESNSVYELIKKSADELAGRRIMLEKDGSWLRLNWLSYAEYKKGSGHIEIRFDKALKPYLLGLKGYFTQYDLEKVVNFKSGYSMRLFELLKKEQFKADGKGYFRRSFEYDEFRALVGIEKTEYRDFSDFRKRVIDSSVKEINANPDIQITQVNYPKIGRKVSHVVFHCEKAKQLQLDIDEPPPKFEEVQGKKEHPEYISELIAIGIDQQTAYRWKRKYTVARLREAIAYTKAMQKSGKIRDSVTGFLARAVTDNIGATWVNELEKKEADKVKTDNLETEKLKAESKALEKQRAERELILSRFNSRTDKEKLQIRSEYEGSLKEIPLRTWNKAKTANPNEPELNKTVYVSFLNFYSVWERDNVRQA